MLLPQVFPPGATLIGYGGDSIASRCVVGGMKSFKNVPLLLRSGPSRPSRAGAAVKWLQEDISRYRPWEGIHPSMSYVLAAENPRSAANRVTTRYGRESRSRIPSASAVRVSSSPRDSSGRQVLTRSTLLNWCWRIIPRTSFPCDPASARKQGGYAVILRGSDPAGRVSSRPLVGM